MNPRHILSSGLAAMPVDASGVPFDCSYIYASGNIAADMYANVTAESTGRALAVRLHNMTPDPGMKDMLKFLIARDTMHQNQWLAAIEELGGRDATPIPNSFPQSEEKSEYAYVFLGFEKDGAPPLDGRWSHGTSVDGKGEFSARIMAPEGEMPNLGRARPGSGAQAEQIEG